MAKPFSAAAAKKKWQSLEKTINQLALNKQAVASMEREMERSVSLGTRQWSSPRELEAVGAGSLKSK